MNGPTKKEQIRRLKAHNADMSAAQIADELNCSRDWVYEVWEPGADPSDYPEPGVGTPDAEGTGSVADGSAGIEAAELHDAATDAADADESNPLADLVIDDDWEEYECGNCGAEVNYLQDECDECGEGLEWWADA
jgi:hypothetical protein